LELGAKRGNEQYRPVFEALDNHVEQLTGGRIDPLQILKHNQHGPLAGQGLDLA